MKIAVYDRAEVECKRLGELLSDYAVQEHETVTVAAFGNCFDLLGSIQDGATYDLVFLDAEGDALGGLEVAREICRIYSDATIVFCARTADYAAGAFTVSALHYLLKPVTKAKVGEVMERFTCLKKLRDTTVMTVRTSEGFYRISSRSIMYMESSGHKLTVTVDGATPICLYGKLDEYAQAIGNDSRFLRIHKSYLVNINYIRYFGTDSVTMVDNIVLKISRAFMGTAKKLFCEYTRQN